jgi:hypothetical protein
MVLNFSGTSLNIWPGVVVVVVVVVVEVGDLSLDPDDIFFFASR